MLPTVALCTPNVTGKWSGTLQMDGENDAKPAYSIFNQDGNKLSGSVGPNESEQDSFEGGKVDGDKLTFDVPQGPNAEGSIHIEMQVKGDQMTGRATWSGPPPHSGSGKISLKRVVEKEKRGMRRGRLLLQTAKFHSGWSLSLVSWSPCWAIFHAMTHVYGGERYSSRVQ